MSYITLVAIVNRLNDLAPEKFGLKLRHLPIWLHFQVSVQTASVDEFHDKEDLLVRFKHFIKFCDVLVVKLFHDFHLAFYTFSAIRLNQFCFLVYFYSYLLVELTMQTKSYDCIGPLTDPLPYEIIVQILDRAISRTKLIVNRLSVFEVLEHFILRMSILFVIFVCGLIIHRSWTVRLGPTFRRLPVAILFCLYHASCIVECLMGLGCCLLLMILVSCSLSRGR